MDPGFFILRHQPTLRKALRLPSAGGEAANEKAAFCAGFHEKR